MGAVQTALRYGRIVRNEHGKLDPDVCDQMWDENTKKRPIGPTDGRHHKLPGGAKKRNGADPSLTKREKKIADVQFTKLAQETELAGIKLEQAAGRLIDREEAGSLLFEWCRTERDSWLSFASRFGAQIASEGGGDLARITRAVEKYVRIYLRELAETSPPPQGINPGE